MHSPKKSTETAAKELSMSKTTVWRVLPKRLVFKHLPHPYGTTIVTVAVKNIDTPVLTHEWQELEYLIDVCRVTRGAHIELF
jgi:hypothetical protein